MSLTERWSYFLIPLPDPIGIKDGHVFKFPRYVEQVVNGAIKTTENRILASICIRQIESEAHELNAANDYFSLAQKIWPLATETTKGNTLDEPPSSVFTRTVAEVAVTPLDNAWRDYLGLDENEDLYHQFEIALSSVNSLLDEYRLVAKLPVRLATLELLPPFIPQAFGDLSEGTFKEPENFSHSMYLLSPHRLFVPEQFTEVQTTRFSSNLELSGQPHPLRPYASVRSDAYIAQQMHGDQRMSIILVATSCEILINAVLKSLMWETGSNLESSAKVFHRSVLISRRLERFVDYFSATWNRKTVPELVRWDEDIARLRNRVVHEGTSPKKEEVDRAWVAMDGLLALLKKNLEEYAQQYPRTLSWLVADRLHDLSPEAFQVVMDARCKKEPVWNNLLENWSKAITNQNEKPSPTTPLSPPRFVVYTDFSSAWITTDADENFCCVVDPSYVIGVSLDSIPKTPANIKDLKDAHPEGLPEPLVLTIEGARVGEDFEPEWKPIHEIDPRFNYLLEK